MALFNNERANKVTSITGVTTVDSTADSITCNDTSLTIYCVSGNLWLNPNATAVADATAYKMTSTSAPLTLCVKKTLSLISDVTTATYQIIVWE